MQSITIIYYLGGYCMNMKKKVLPILLILMFAASMVVYGARAQEEAREEVVVGALARQISSALLPFLDEFEQETGIRVTIEQHSADALHDKMMLGAASKAGHFDIVYVSPSWFGAMVENDYLLPLNDYYEKYNFDLDDFVGASVDMCYYEGGSEIWAVPYVADTKVLMYRIDLFESASEQQAFKARYGYDLQVPETTEQLRDMAEFFTRPDEGLYGYGAPMMGALNWVWALTKIWTYGGNIYDSDYNVIINSPESLKAWQWAEQMLSYMPAGVLAWEYGEHLTYMTQGRLAMTEGYYQFGVTVNDPDQSDMAGNIGYAVLPRAPESGFATGKHVIGGGSLGIPSDAQNPDAAFTFLNWMFGDKDRALVWYLNGGAATRSSVFESEEVLAQASWLEDLHPIAIRSLDEVAVSRPVIPEAYMVLDAIIDGWSSVGLGNQTPASALAQTEREIARILAHRQ